MKPPPPPVFVRRWSADAVPGLTATALAASARTAFGRHTHDGFVVSHVQAGTKRITSRSDSRLVSPGTGLVVVPPSIPHFVESGETGFEHHALIFDQPHLTTLLEEQGQGRAEDMPMFIDPDPRLVRVFALAHRAMRERDACLPLRRDAFVHILAAALLLRGDRTRRLPRPAAERLAARRARAIINEGFREKIGLRWLAEASGTTPLRLLRAFDREFGLPPHRFQMQLRIREAQAMLKQGVPPAFVAADLGFVDQSHFTRHFRRYAGTTPGDYARAAGP